MPFVLWMASLGLVVWAAWRTFGKHAAVLSGVLGLCVSPTLALHALHVELPHVDALQLGDRGRPGRLPDEAGAYEHPHLDRCRRGCVRSRRRGRLGPACARGRDRPAALGRCRSRNQASDAAGTHGRARGRARRRRGGRYRRGRHADHGGVRLRHHYESRGLEGRKRVPLTDRRVPGGGPTDVQRALLRAAS